MPLKTATIVIPTYKAPALLHRQLAVYEDLISKNAHEVIIVDDGQNTAFCLPHNSKITLFRNPANLGVSKARNVGLSQAKNNLVVFIDDDVEVDYHTLNTVITRFSHSSSIAFSCMHSTFHSKDNFPTRYKAMYMNVTLNNVKAPITFIYGSLCGLKKEYDFSWQESLHYGEDTYLATEIINDGYEIDFYKDLSFKHHKSYSYLTLFKNDFLIPFHFAKSYLLQKKKRIKFSHTTSQQLFAIASIPLVLLNPMAIALWFYLNKEMYRNYPYENKILLTCFTFIDQTIMGLGILFGLIKATYNLLSSNKSLDLND